MCRLKTPKHFWKIPLDDILLYGRDQEKHNKNLKVVLQAIRESGLKLNKDKCHFNKTELCFFGFIISSEGVRPDPDKVKGITDLSHFVKV